jgi:integrase
LSTGNRKALPDNAMKACASCGEPRGTKSKGWANITRAGAVVGFTCPNCPADNEPIRLEASGRFLVETWVRRKDGTRKKYKSRFAELSDAREWLAEVREDAAKPGDQNDDPRRYTVRQVADRWLAKREAEVGTAGGIRMCSLNGYRSSLSSLLDLLGDRRARDITPDDVEAALLTLATAGGKRGRRLSHRSLTYALGALRQVYAYALRSKWVKSNPASEAKAPGQAHAASDTTESAKSLKRWTPAQLVAFRTYVDGLPLAAEPWLRVGMRLTLCGLRRSEVLGLDWSNVDLKTGNVRISASRTKDGRSNTSTIHAPKSENSRRTVQAEVIHPGTAAALRTLWLTQGCPKAGLVITDAADEPVQPDAYSRRFTALCKAANVPTLTRIHNTRHSLASALKEAGVPDNQAAALLGHDVQTYQRFYLPLDDDGAAAAAQIAGRLFAVV